MPEKRESRPAGTERQSSGGAASNHHSTGHRRQDGYTAPTGEDRREAQVIAEAKALGYRLAIRCTECGHWLASPRSVELHMGPVCRGKAATNV
jgi:hypothetical protein